MTNKARNYTIYSEQGCLTQKTIVNYLAGKLSEADTFLVQKHISECNLCNEAVQGTRNFSDPEQYRKGVDQLKDRWSRRNVGGRRISSATLASVISVAASVVLIISIYFADRYQKKIRRQYMISVYEHGAGLNEVLNSSGWVIPFGEGNSSANTEYEIAAREKYRKLIPDLEKENIPIAILAETTIKPGKKENGTEVDEQEAPEKNEQKKGILRYPYRVMSMPPPEKKSSGKSKETTENLFYIVEDMPKFQDKGVQQFSNYVKKNLHYPSQAMEKHLAGKVYLQFVIDEKGQLTDAIILKGSYPVLNREVLRVVNSSPKWQPGKQRGKPVKVSMVMPVDFVLY